MTKITKIANIRGYKNSADRERAVKMLSKQGYTYFARYADAASFYSLSFAK